MDISYKEELFSTPKHVSSVIRELNCHQLASGQKFVFCGCGTSFYLGTQCAYLCVAEGRKASSVDAIDILAGYALPEADSTYIFISRSGNSEETFQAASTVKSAGVATFYLGCSAESRLNKLCDASCIMPCGSEHLVLESYSYYVQMIGALRCCGVSVDESLPMLISNALSEGQAVFSQYLKNKNIGRIISLASPFYRPLHREMMLKDGEITQLPSEEWGILEVRHGPRCWCDETTLIHIISEEKTYQFDIKVAEELIGYGCPTIWYGKNAPEGCYEIDFDITHRSAAETLLFGAFHTSIATEIGMARNTKPEALKHIVHNVGEL